MFGINGLEFVVLALIAVLVIGPERMPEYAAQLGRLAREVRRMATGARTQLRDEVGSEFTDVDWRKLDPRQYDPRRIIKEALLEQDEPVKPQSPNGPGTAELSGAAAAGITSAPDAPAGSGDPAGPGADGRGSSAAAAFARPSRRIARLAAGQRAPFDTEAT